MHSNLLYFRTDGLVSREQDVAESKQRQDRSMVHGELGHETSENGLKPGKEAWLSRLVEVPWRMIDPRRTKYTVAPS